MHPHCLNRDVFAANPDLREAALACVVMRKQVDQPFRYPIQGTYRHLTQYAEQAVRA